MRKYLFIVLLVGVCFGQDILKMDGKELKGEFIRFNADKKTFTFKFEGRDKPSDLPLDENRLDYIMLKNGEWAYVSPNFVEEVRKIEMAKKCEDNKSIKVSIIPLKNDKWTITESLQKDLVEACFIVETSYIRVFKYFNDKKIKISDINDAHILKAQQDLGIDRLLFGSVEKIDDDFASFTAYYLLPQSGDRIYMYINYPSIILNNYIDY